MNYEPAWNRLLASLNTWAEAREVEGGIEVSYVQNGSQRRVEIVMTPDDYEELADNVGKEDEASIKRLLLGLDADERFLVCLGGVELIASATRELPPDEDLRRGPGRWVATDESSSDAVSRFADWNGKSDFADWNGEFN